MDGPPANDCCSVCRGNFNVPCQANCSHWFCGDCIMLVWHHGSAIQPCKCPLCRRQITLLIPGEASLRDRRNPEVAEVLAKIETYNRLFGRRNSSLVQRMQDLPFLLRRLSREMMDPQRSLPLVIRARVYISVMLITSFTISLDAFMIACMTLISLVLIVEILDLFGFPEFLFLVIRILFCLLLIEKLKPENSKMILGAVYVLSPIDIIPEGILGIVGLLDDLLIAAIAFLHIASIYRSVLYFRHGGS